MNTSETKPSRRRTAAEGLRDFLSVLNQDPNYVYRLAADNPARPGRVEHLQELGYEVVQDKDVELGEPTVDRRTKQKLGSAVTRPGGSGITLVLMRQRREWWEEDQAFKQAKVDALEEAMQMDVERGVIPGSKESAVGGKLVIKSTRHKK
jgi:hypothetical protein